MGSHRFTVRTRAFTIWQKLGIFPWSKPKAKSKKGDFYKGAFDSIPFLNDDAKRTFIHLLLRPGYMIRDYIKGQHERYLAPLTSLIIFFAFFAFVSSVVNPDYSPDKKEAEAKERTFDVHISDDVDKPKDLDEPADTTARLRNDAETAVKDIAKLADFIKLLSLDKHPELVDSPFKASLAALESNLRSQGVYLFLGQFLLLWIAMYFALRKHGLSLSACAAASAYVLCQFCFFMLFALFFPWGERGEIGAGLSGLLLMIDYRQLFDLEWKRSLKLTLKTGLYYVLIYLLIILILSGIVLAALFLHSKGIH